MSIEIYWDDLTPEKQEEIVETFGDNCNYDVFPIAVITQEREPEQFIPQM